MACRKTQYKSSNKDCCWYLLVYNNKFKLIYSASGLPCSGLHSLNSLSKSPELLLFSKRNSKSWLHKATPLQRTHSLLSFCVPFPPTSGTSALRRLYASKAWAKTSIFFFFLMAFLVFSLWFSRDSSEKKGGEGAIASAAEQGSRRLCLTTPSLPSFLYRPLPLPLAKTEHWNKKKRPVHEAAMPSNY